MIDDQRWSAVPEGQPGRYISTLKVAALKWGAERDVASGIRLVLSASQNNRALASAPGCNQAVNITDRRVFN